MGNEHELECGGYQAAKSDRDPAGVLEWDSMRLGLVSCKLK